MTSHLVSLSIGPVQDFIAQARRSRDLWFGSHILSEISRSAAKAVAENGGKLIFPALQLDDPELDACDGMMRNDTHQPPLAIANKILFEADDAETSDSCVDAAFASVKQRWSDLAAQALKSSRDLVDPSVLDGVWHEQIDGVIELFAATAPVTEDDFSKVRRELEVQISARKNVRSFQQYQYHRRGAPKSSLDGGRVSVLANPRQNRTERQQFRIPSSEHLDAVGVVKRVGGKPRQFVPIANIAFTAWLEDVKHDADVKSQLDELCEMMTQGIFGKLFGQVDRRDTPAGRAFASDSQIFMDGRCEALILEHQAADRRNLNTDKDYMLLDRSIKAIWQSIKSSASIPEYAKKAPHPYVAAIVADGDRMGQALGTLTNAADLRTFSRKLSEFANQARSIIEQDCRGSLLYAGGDDVVAFVPVRYAVHCANELQQKFKQLMKSGEALPANWDHSNSERQSPTLSVGVGIGHVLAGMGNLLKFGREAEADAKGGKIKNKTQQRNALAIVFDKRSGGHLRWRSQWRDNAEQAAIKMIDAAIRRMGGNDSSALAATKLAEIDRDLKRFPKNKHVTADSSSGWARILSQDVARTLARNSGFNDASVDQCPSNNDYGLDLSANDYQMQFESIEAWVSLNRIAKELHRSGCQPINNIDEVDA